MLELIVPRHGPGVCPECFNYTLERDERCRACRLNESHLRVMSPLSYAVSGGVLHRWLADYKRTAEPAVPGMIRTLAEILDAFLAGHERCLAAGAGVPGFDAVGVVPSGDARRDRAHPLRALVGGQVPALRGRYRELLANSGTPCLPHRFDRRRFRARAPLDGEHILLVDDMWTTGASAQSAAAELLDAGAASVSAVVLGRYLNAGWGDTAQRLERLAARGSSGRCPRCDPGRLGAVAPSYTLGSPQGGRSSVG